MQCPSRVPRTEALANNITPFTASVTASLPVQNVAAQLQSAAAAGHSSAVATVATVSAALESTWGRDRWVGSWALLMLLRGEASAPDVCHNSAAAVPCLCQPRSSCPAARRSAHEGAAAEAAPAACDAPPPPPPAPRPTAGCPRSASRRQSGSLQTTRRSTSATLSSRRVLLAADVARKLQATAAAGTVQVHSSRDCAGPRFHKPEWADAC